MIEALLAHLYQPDANHQEMVIRRTLTAVAEIQNFPESTQEHSSQRPPSAGASRGPSPADTPSARLTWALWSSPLLAVAAAVLLAAWVILGTTQPDDRLTAAQAVQQALSNSLEPVVREYLVQRTVRRPLGGQKVLEASLFVQGNDRLLIRQRSNLPPGAIWRICQNGDEAWLVPPAGPVLVGRADLVESLLSEKIDLDTPYLHVTTILQRLKDRYELTFQPDVYLPEIPPTGASTPNQSAKRTPAIADITDQPSGANQHAEPGLAPSEFSGNDLAEGKSVPCRVVHGQLAKDDPRWPQRITLLAERSDGTVRQLELIWQPKIGPRSLLRLRLELVSRPQKDADWFSHSSHHRPNRRVLHLNQPRLNTPGT